MLPLRLSAGRCLPALALALAGCAAHAPDVRSLATGRSDVSVYELTGQDLATLRLRAQHLCPLGGEILRQAGPPAPPESATGWRSALDITAVLAEPAGQPAQMLLACRQPGERSRLQAAASAMAPVARPDPALPSTAASAPASPATTSQWTAALPVGPVTPEW